MFAKELLLIFVIFSAVLILRTNAAPSKYSNPKSKNIQKNIERNQEYNDRIADIFEIPVPETSKIMQECKNIVCTHFTLCVDDIVSSNGIDLFELRLSTRSDIDGEANRIVCGDFEMPCCADQAIAKANHKQRDENPKKYSTITDNQDADVDASLDLDSDLDYDSNESVAKCGSIIGDKLLEIDRPWLVSLYLRNAMDQLQYIGGGSLIQSSVILTAAHAIMEIQPEMLIIRAGGDHNVAEHQERSVTNIIIHEEFFVRTLINDIALIVVDRPFELTNYVSTICLPSQNHQTSGGIMCTAIGWNHGYQSAVLEKFELPIVDQNQCEHRLRQTRLGQYFLLNPSLMCAGGLGFETCKGDRGSPLICTIPHLKNRFYQTGIMAGSLGCGENTPGIYVNVAHFTDWIQQQLRFIGHNLDSINIIQFKYFD